MLLVSETDGNTAIDRLIDNCTDLSIVTFLILKRRLDMMMMNVVEHMMIMIDDIQLYRSIDR